MGTKRLTNFKSRRKRGKRKVGNITKNKNAVQILNELKPNAQFSVLSQTGPVHAPTFVVSFSINGQTFEGKGGNKKIAKLNAAENALKSIVQHPIYKPVKNGDFTTDENFTNKEFITSATNSTEFESPIKCAKAINLNNNKEEKINPVVVLNEMCSKVEYKLIFESGIGTNKSFLMAALVNGKTFQGGGRNKKVAKARAASNALAYMYNLNLHQNSFSKINLICEHKTLNMACPNGQILRIRSAKYGRDKGDTKTCPEGSVRRFASRIKSNNCEASTSVAKTRANCDDLQKCSVLAKNSLFGDPSNVAGYTLHTKKDYPGHDIDVAKKSNRKACRDLCERKYGCAGFAFVTNSRTCYLKKEARASGGNFKNNAVVDLYIRTKGANVVSGYSRHVNKDYPGFDIKLHKLTSYDSCSKLCDANHLCLAFEFHIRTGNCYLKSKGETSGPNFKDHNFGDFFFKLGEVEGYHRYIRKDFPGSDIREYKKSNVKDCAGHCNAQYNCIGFAFLPNVKSCYIKHTGKPSGTNFINRATVDIYFRLNLVDANIKGYKRYQFKDYPSYDMKRYFNSNPFDCAKYCEKTIGCFGTVFLFSSNICHLKSQMQTSGANFKNLDVTDLYFRIDGPNTIGENLVCEHKTMTISCPTGTGILVVNAKYGRDKSDLTTCPNNSINKFKSRILSKNCESGLSNSKSLGLCHAKRTCQISAKNNIFGDPCKGIFKYLRVKYKCINYNFKGYKHYKMKDYPGYDIKQLKNLENDECVKACDQTTGCIGALYNFQGRFCYLKHTAIASGPNFKYQSAADLYIRSEGPAPTLDGYKRYPFKQYPNFDIKKLTKTNHVKCSEFCNKDNRCAGFVFHASIKTCYVKYEAKASGSNFKTYGKSDLYLRIGGHKADVKGYKRYPTKDYPHYDIRYYDRSTQQACANHCDDQYNCVGFEFIFTISRCYIKHRAEAKGKNFKNNPIGDLYIREGPARQVNVKGYTRYPLKISTSSNILKITLSNIVACGNECDNKQGCYGFAFDFKRNDCYLKTKFGSVAKFHNHQNTDMFVRKAGPSTSTLDLTCEHETLAIACPVSQVVKVLSAKYGRDKGDLKICHRPSVTKFQKRVKSSNCESGKSLNAVKNLCEGKDKCSILAKNNVFSDPCVGIFKYLRVRYQCVDAVTVCFDKFKNKHTPRHEDKILKSVASARACQYLCQEEESFNCVFAEYYKSGRNARTCVLSKYYPSGSELAGNSAIDSFRRCDFDCNKKKGIFNPYNNICYRLHNKRTTYDAARKNCQRSGGELASLTSFEDWSFIKRFRYIIPDYAYVGATDQFLENQWYFPMNGVFLPLNIPYFGKPVEPNGKTFENCLMLSRKDAKGIDVSCSVPKYSICEFRTKISTFDYNSYSLAFGKGLKNKKLTIKPTKRQTVKTIDDCFKACAMDPKCKSFGYHKSKKCAFYDNKNSFTNPSQLAANSGWTHYDHVIRKYDHCPANAIKDPNSDLCLKHYAQKVTHAMAGAKCKTNEKKSGRLIIDTDVSKNLIQQNKRRFPDLFWNGAVDINREGVWYYNIGKKSYRISKAYWSAREPNGNTIENCVMERNHKNSWIDVSCDAKKFYTCEYRASPQTGPNDMLIEDVPGYHLYLGKDYPGYDIQEFKNSNSKDCAKRCNEKDICLGFAFLVKSKRCFIKSQVSIAGKNFKSIKNINLYVRLNAPSIRDECYKKVPRHHQPGHNNKVYKNIANAYLCKLLCVQSDAFKCLSFEFHTTGRNKNQCVLSRNFPIRSQLKANREVNTYLKCDKSCDERKGFYNPYIDVCYRLDTRKMTWPKAQEVCRKENGQLAVLPTTQDWTFLMRIRNKIPNYAWVGLTDDYIEGRWYFHHGDLRLPTIISYINKPVEPNGKTVENCLFLQKSNGKGVDDNCFAKRAFFCEYRNSKSILNYNYYNLEFQYRGKKVLSVAPTKVMAVKNINDCYKTCVEDLNCKSFAYHISKKCAFYSNANSFTHSDQFKVDRKWRHYDKYMAKYDHCPPNSVKDYTSDFCMKLYKTPVDWATAEKNCKTNDGKIGHLIVDTPRSKTLMNQFKASFSGNFWNGVTDANNEGVWHYHVGDKSYKIERSWWGAREPNGKTVENCVFENSGRKSWIDQDCSKKYNYVCAYNARERVIAERFALLKCEKPGAFGDKKTGICYKQFKEQVNFNTASQNCKKDGGQLAVLPAGQSRNFLFRRRSTLKGNFWIGATDRNLEGFWEWNFGNKLFPGTGLVWKSKGFRENSKNDCAAMEASDIKAISQKCSKKASYLCEYRPKKAGVNIVWLHGYETRSGYEVSDKSPFVQTKSVVDCAARCYKNQKCYGFNYSINKKKCQYLTRKNYYTHPKDRKRNSRMKTYSVRVRKYDHCPKNAIKDPVEGTCYKYFGKKVSWKKALKNCRKSGGKFGNLVVPTKRSINFLYSRRSNFPGKWWIGVTDITTENLWQFRWNGAEKRLVYAQWASKPIRDPSKNCVSSTVGGRKWTPKNCDDKLGYICQYTPVQPPTNNLLSFGRHRRRILKGYDDRSLSNVKSALDCANACQKWGKCRSFDYSSAKKICNLSKQSRITRPRAFIKNRMFDNYYHTTRSLSHCPRDAFYDPHTPLRCYKAFNKPLTWKDAAQSCFDNGGGRLVAIPNIYSLRSIRRALRVRPIEYWTALNDIREEGVFAWTWGVTQTKLGSWSYWLKNSNNDKLNCGYAQRNKGDKWALSDCENSKPYICEYRSEGDTEINVPCPLGWKTYESNCYYPVASKSLGWNDARTMCKNSGADLVSVTSIEEQKYVNSLIKKSLRKKKSVWMGLNDIKKEADWLWSDGSESSDFSNWEDPNEQARVGKSEDCGYFNVRKGYKWGDDKCNAPKAFICKGNPKEMKSTDCMTRKLRCPANAICEDGKTQSSCKCSAGLTPVIRRGRLIRCQASNLCRASGDPHYRTFDGAIIHFMGVCKYTLSEPCGPKTKGKPKWSVKVINERRGRNMRVSFTKIVDIEVYEKVIRFMKNGVILVDGVRSLPQNLLGGRIKISSFGLNKLSLSTDFGLIVRFSGNHMAEVISPANLRGQLCGLCGNWDGNKNNDYFPKGRNSKGSYVDIGNSWMSKNQEEQSCSIQDDEEDVTTDCDPNLKNLITKKCQKMSTLPAFKPCHKKLSPTDAIEECIFDLCASKNKEEVYCDALETYSESCRMRGVVVEFRSKNLCAPNCPPNSVFKSQTSACPATCLDKDAPDTCKKPNTEGCECKDGFLRNGAKCVPEKQCGCVAKNGLYHDYKDKWLNKKCTIRYTCLKGGKIIQRVNKCHRHAFCGVRKGKRGCHCKKGFRGNGLKCFDINECRRRKHNCRGGSRCVNTIGSFRCKCKRGYRFAGGRCRDINECKGRKKVCKNKCINTMGGYRCVCNNGFIKRRGRRICKPVNECKTGVAKCPKGSICRDTRRGYVCRCPKRRRLSTNPLTGKKECMTLHRCSAAGDPHYRTFDGLRLDFMGTCKYTLAKTCPKKEQENLPDFNVEVLNEHRGKKTTVSYTALVDIDVYGYRIRLKKGRRVIIGKMKESSEGLRSMTNGILRTVPIRKPGFVVKREGRFVVLRTDFGLAVTFDGRSRAIVELPSYYKNMGMCGICGNFDGNKKNDIIGSDGKPAPPTTIKVIRRGKTRTRYRYADLGNSWEVIDRATKPGCRPLRDEPGQCTKKEEQNLESKNKYKNNQDLIDDELDNCVFDACLVKDNRNEMICKSIEDFADKCREKYDVAVVWRKNNFCPLKCQANAVYAQETSSCPATCENPDADPNDCEEPPKEGCVCKKGFVLDGNNCIPSNKCGCKMPDGGFMEIGQFYSSEDCTIRFTCEKNRDFKEVKLGKCNKRASCRVKDGVRSCHCKRGWIGNGYKGCTDENECKTGTHKCSKDANCINEVGGYDCKCKRGFTGDGRVCIPLPPCEKGFERNEDNKCIDINECERSPCHENAKCFNTRGSYKCKCAKGFRGDGKRQCFRYYHCYAAGDPHYKTFDGQKFDFMGTCQYTLAKPCPEAEKGGLPAFNVEVRNYHRPNRKKTVSYTKYVDIQTLGYNVRLGQRLRVTINGAKRRLNFGDKTKGLYVKLVIKRRRRYVVLKTNFGLKVTWDGNTRVRVDVPDTYKNRMCGMCGNMDGNKQNDLVTKDGKPINAIVITKRGRRKIKAPELGDSYKVGGPPHCRTFDDPQPECSVKQEQEAEKLCNILINEKGPLGSCIKKKKEDALRIYNDCIADLCAMNGDNLITSSCSAIEDFVETCEEAIEGFNAEWRKFTDCPVTCPENMEFKLNAPSCDETCGGEISGDCDDEPSSRCICKPGFVLQGTNCVEKTNCGGCKDENGITRDIGETWSTANCKKQCTCKSNGNSKCANHPNCIAMNAKCIKTDGEWGCNCERGLRMNNKGECDDIDECREKTDTCHSKATCTNEIPGFKCKCKPGFTGNGFQCKPEEQNPQKPPPDEEFTEKEETIKQACEHQSLNIKCQPGKVLKIKRAFYGRARKDMKTCKKSSLNKFISTIQNKKCQSLKSLKVIRKACNSKRQCTILAKNTLFGDPCPGIFKYLKIAYTCQNDAKTKTACEHKVLKLACPAGRKIAVRRAVYGRGKGDMKVCPQKSLSKFQKRIAASVCASKKSLSQVRKFCNGKRRCNVLAKNNVFGDPCPGIFKYLRVAYVCKKVLATPPKPKPKPNVKTGVTCEHKVLKLACPAGRKIAVRRAVYGRGKGDMKVCPQKSLSKFQKRIAASVCASKKSLSQVRKFCNGKRRCNVLAKNNVFGDPCPGIFKYLRVAYVCKKVLATPPKPKPKPNVKTGVTCEHKVLKLACPAGRKIAVRRAVYGRGKGDMKVCPQKSLSKFQKRIAASVCASKKSLSQVRKFCNGKRRCNVLAKNNVFGDPCPGIFKYLRVAYVCKKVLATPPKPKPKPNVKTGVTCEHKVLKLACPAGRKIAVRRAVYGRGKGDMKVCPQKSLSKFQKRIAASVCASKKSLSQVRKFCNGKRRCNVLAKNNVFGDPCPGIFKYLRVAYVCKKVLATPPKPKPKPNVKTGVTCEHKVLKLACPAGRKIAVRRAVYGRGKGDMKVCPQKSLSKFQKRIAASVCASKKSLSQVRKFCNGKRRCNVLAKNNVFGDPCPGIFKYLRVAYVCKKVLATPPKPKPKPNVKTGVTCEHKVLKLACPAGRKIAVRRAVYGRGKGDMKVCPQKSLSKFQKRIAASVCASKKSLSQVRKFCNGKRRCNVLAKNNVFGDPCPGIFKYLRVAYVCKKVLATPPKPKPKPNVKTGVTCEHKVLKLACPAGRKIAVRRAVYGRGKGDMKVCPQKSLSKFQKRIAASVCASKKSLSQVRKFCNGKRRCNVLAKNNVFGDPCPGIFKYLRVAYVCKKVLATPPKPKPKPNVKTGVTCEHKVLKLACPAGRKIAVRRAVYGRGKGDMKVCPQKSLSKFQKRIAASVCASKKSLSQVRKFCNGKRRCNVLAKNNVFGDPCPGIFKYLRVAYVCKKVLATPPKPKPKPNVKTGVTCEHKVLKLACPAGRKIAVRRAVYGRGKGDMKVCPQKSLSKFQKRIAASVCASKKSLSQVRKFCNGKRRCNVLAKNNVFGDPCPGIFKYLRVAYVCKKVLATPPKPKPKPNVKTGVTCEHKVLKLACPAGRKIAVRRAVYGRGKGDMKVCPQKSLSKFQKRIAASVCASKKSLSQVRKFCNGKRRCNVLAKNNVFGDPCPGIFKYLRVAYVCKKVLATPPKPKPKPNVKTGVTCEHKVLKLACPAGRKIAVRRAVYGRGKGDMKVCPQKSLSKFQKRIAASVCASKKSLSQVRKFCNGKRRCNVLAKNNVFGDPCPGIFKYLRVAYVCKKVLATPPKPKPKPNVKTGVTCEHKVLKLACPAGRKIAVRRAVYGRERET
ncbi:DgyrCDS5627 [Dimorphilus gyrociliatus]|uniref:DgyrCDS5627 n=1 Tax=Dimorphilus gyrociliatus TaxID=2664684 RepID=A0A7I8VKJ1_9ANNE|nr:DgyrCDS5627 [Dimorphilus gyrociliatus]